MLPRAGRTIARGDNHHEAEKLLEEVTPGGKDGANALRRLLDLKDEAHYGFFNIGQRNLDGTMRQARKMRFARDVLSR